jgi:glycosyltransferase involved in cell wall biosynthesis
LTINPTFSVIVPAYNEEHGVRQAVTEIHKTFSRLGHHFEIIIVDDGSTDKTNLVLKDLARIYREVALVPLPGNRGKGYAIREGVANSSGNYVVFMDADLDIHPSQARVLDMFRNERCDIAIGSKRHPQSKVDYPLSRKVISTIYYWIVKILFDLNVRDTQAGLKIYRREVLSAVLPRLMVKKFAFDLEMLVAANNLGYEIQEFPIKVNFSRKFGRISFKDCWHTGIDTLAIFYRNKILNFYRYDVCTATSTPKVSIMIPAADSNENLTHCINTCLAQDYENYEIIVLPDNDNSGFLLPFSNNKRITILQTGPMGPSSKRNIGALKASGEIFAFLDDDAFPRYDWISTAVKHFGAHDVAAVGGPAVTPADSTFRERISGHIFASFIVSGNYRYRYVPHRYREIDDYPSCNLFVLRDVFTELGGFSTQHWPGEDTFFCRDIIMKTGKKIVYDPHVLVEHQRRPIFAKHLKQIAGYALHRGYFVKRWPENSLKLAYFIPSLLTAFIVLGIPLCMFPAFRLFYLITTGFYLCICFIASIRLSGISETFLTFIGSIATHLTYGTYFIAGMMMRRLPEHKPVKDKRFSTVALSKDEPV